MSNASIIARPYAKAVFEYALDTKALVEWSNLLEILSCVVLDPRANQFITNPVATPEQLIALLLTPFPPSIKEWEHLNYWVQLLVEQGRLLVLPEIYKQYQILRAEYEKTVVVDVRSYSELTKTQVRLLSERLSKKLNRAVRLSISVDPTILGGAVIQAGDLVIDGSIQGKLNAMYEGLLA
jgi:F-type H+-transporting ATPase subunit delta